MIEERKAKLVLNKSGSGSSTFRATIPTKWVRSLNLNENNRNVILQLHENYIKVIPNYKEEL